MIKIHRKPAKGPTVLRFKDLIKDAKRAKADRLWARLSRRFKANEEKYLATHYAKRLIAVSFTAKSKEPFPVPLDKLEDDSVYVTSVIISQSIAGSKFKAFYGRTLKYGWKTLHLATHARIRDEALRAKSDAALRINRFIRVKLPNGRQLEVQPLHRRHGASPNLDELNERMGW